MYKLPKVFRGYLIDETKKAEFIEKGWSNAGETSQARPDYEGIVFTDDTVAVRWLTEYRSTTTWNNYEDFQSCYGSGYEIEWL